MAHHEQPCIRDGAPASIQCILARQNPTSVQHDFHYHEYTELLFGVEGTSLVFVNDQQYLLRSGEMIIIHNFEIHDVISSGEDSAYIVIKFLPSILLTAEQSYHEYSYALCLMQNTETKQNFFTRAELEDTPVPALFHHALREWYGHDFGYELALRADVTTIFLHILRKWHERNMSGTDLSNWQSELIQKAVAYVDQHYVDLTEESTAEALGVSPSYLSRIFRKGMKTTFSAYVNSIKLQEAERMLIGGPLSVTEIGSRVGFTTSAYFIACFRKRHGITPVEYRKRLRG